MANSHQCGPDHHHEFFEAIRAVFRQFPDEAKQYSVKCIDHETDMMHIDFATQVGISRIENGTVITEFHPIDQFDHQDMACCIWCLDPRTGEFCGVSRWAEAKMDHADPMLQVGVAASQR